MPKGDKGLDISSGDDLPSNSIGHNAEAAPNVVQIEPAIEDPINGDSAQIRGIKESLKLLKLNDKKPCNEAEQNQSFDLNPEEIDTSDVSECPPIVLVAGDKREIRPFRNRYEILGKFLSPAKIDKWAIVLLFDDRVVLDVEKGLRLFDELRGFAKRYAECGRERGVSINGLDTIQFVPSHPSIMNTIVTMSRDQLRSELRKLVAKLNDNLVDHAIIILPDNCPYWVHGYLQYLETKEWGRLKQPGINSLARTSRMQYDTVIRLVIRSRDRGRTKLIPHIWLKYNTKLGGVNVALKQTFDTHELEFLATATMILSIDVCPLAAASNDLPDPSLAEVLQSLNIVAGVGMWDLSSAEMSFRTETRVQSSNDVATDIGLLVRDIVLSYKRRKGNKLPSRIIILRSVTNRNNMTEVAQKEVSSIKAMLADEFSGPDKQVPTLTYLRVPKRKKISKAEQISKNRRPNQVVQTGSLVDSLTNDDTHDIQQSQGSSVVVNPECHPCERNSGPGLVSGPGSGDAKVIKLYDELNLSKASVKAMFHSLSYLSPRTTTKTRPTPIDLADLANERSRHVSIGWLEDNANDYKGGKEDILERLTGKLNTFLTTEMGDEHFKNTLYYA